MAPTKGKTAAKARGKNIVIDDESEKFLNEIQLRPYIYDKTAGLYSNRDALGKAWEEIGSGFGMTAAEAKERYNSLRDKYTRIKNSMKLPSGSGRKKNKTKQDEEKKFLSSLSFLDKFTQKRRTLGNLDEPRSDGNESYETSSDDSDEGLTSPGDDSQQHLKNASSSKTATPKANKKSKAKSDQFAQILKAMETEEDENDLFAASIATQLKKFSPKKAAVSRMKIQQVIVEALLAENANSVQSSSHMEPSNVARLVNFEDY